MTSCISRNQLCTLCCRFLIRCAALSLKVTGDSPGTHERHFCVPEYIASTPHWSTNTSMPPSEVTASTMDSASWRAARAQSDAALLATPVDVSAWTKARMAASGWLSKAASTLVRLTGSPHLSSTMMAVPPQRSTFSFMRPPNTPFWQTMTLSPGDTRLTKHASMPAEPGADIGSVSALLV